MHSATIFFGMLFFCWGAYSLVVAGVLIHGVRPGDVPYDYTLERWAPYMAAAFMLPLPVGTVTGVARSSGGVFSETKSAPNETAHRDS